MRLWWQEGTLQGHLLPPFKAWAGIWVIFIQGALLKLSLTPNPQQHFPEPCLACFHTGLSLMATRSCWNTLPPGYSPGTPGTTHQEPALTSLMGCMEQMDGSFAPQAFKLGYPPGSRT